MMIVLCSFYASSLRPTSSLSICRSSSLLSFFWRRLSSPRTSLCRRWRQLWLEEAFPSSILIGPEAAARPGLVMTGDPHDRSDSVRCPRIRSGTLARAAPPSSTTMVQRTRSVRQPGPAARLCAAVRSEERTHFSTCASSLRPPVFDRIGLGHRRAGDHILENCQKAATRSGQR
eukprot:749691-Hanusia_phi.AAC.4